jgi:recombination protein RecA
MARPKKKKDEEEKITSPAPEVDETEQEEQETEEICDVPKLGITVDEKEFQKTLSLLGKEFGSIVSAEEILNVPKVSTQNLLLDILTEGGFPMGSITLTYGPFSSGKTVTGLKAASVFTSQAVPVLYIACEGDIDKGWVQKLGNNLKYFHIARPNNLEDAIDLADVAVRSKQFGMVIFDSVTAGIPKETMDKKTEKDQYALQARRNGKLVQKLTSGLQPADLANPETYNNTVVLLIAHLRNKVGVMFGSPETLPGGEALKHHSGLIIKVRPGSKLAKDKDVIGREMVFYIERSKFSNPLVQGTTEFYFDPPRFNNAKVLLTYAIQYGFIQQSGAFYTYNDVRVKGKKELLLELKKNNTLSEIKTKVINRFGDS